MKINLKKLYVVYKPVKHAEKVDVFNNRPTSLHDLYLQFRGGLQPKRIYGIYTTILEAKKVANGIYKRYNIKR